MDDRQHSNEPIFVETLAATGVDYLGIVGRRYQPTPFDAAAAWHEVETRFRAFATLPSSNWVSDEGDTDG
jgi:hypothetical protein